MSALRFDGWVPFRLYWQGSDPGVEWLYMGSRQFTDPFFETTIQVNVQTPFNSLIRFRTPLSVLAGWQAASPGLKPAGFIFHLSRCGSTLISQMLAALPRNVVLSEPGLLDRMLRSHERAPEASVEQRVLWLQWLVSALGQPRTGQEHRLFIKLEPRNIVELPLLRMAFPDVPWIFVYRDPVEVLVSNLRHLAAFVTRGMVLPGFLDFDVSVAAGMDDAEYAARVLGIVAETAARHAAGAQGKLIEYRQLPEIGWDELPRHFGIELTDAERDRMKEIAALDAKQPQRRFTSDTEDKRRAATERTRGMAEQWIGPHYARLEEMRRIQMGGFPAFRRIVLEDPALLDRLSGLPREAFLSAAVHAAAQAGILLAKRDVEKAVEDAHMERFGRLL